MIKNMPMSTIGVCFDIDKVGSGYYGYDCWRIFWGAIAPSELKGVLLYEGDTADTLKGISRVFCVAVHSTNPNIIDRVRNALSQSKEFQKVCAYYVLIRV